MGKATTTEAAASATVAVGADKMKMKKKKGRPSLSDLRNRDDQKSAASRRSTRRNPNFRSSSPPPDSDEDDDERKEKKVKLVRRLPQSTNQPQHFENCSRNSDSGSDPDNVNREVFSKKLKVEAEDCRSELAVPDQVLDMKAEKTLKVTDSQHGSPLAFDPTKPLPDKKLLLFILDRLQKKDTYGVFSEPVDPNELPDYHEIIEHPMDFGTVRKKLDGRRYTTLEELEADVLLICSNAMEYNAPDTVYFRQARSIQELAKRDFENLRHQGEDGEPKVVRRGRPPNTKNMKKCIETSPVDRVGSELSSGATLACVEDIKAAGSNSYNLRKGLPVYRFRSNDISLYRPRNGDGYAERTSDWNEEFPANILRADMKYGSKHFAVDDNRRDTYKQFNSTASGNEPSLFDNAYGNVKWLMAVGIQLEQHAYARSLSKFAANLGPVAWNIASKKLQHILPPGVEFGPGWVGESVVQPLASSLSTENQNLPLASSLSTENQNLPNRPLTPPFPASNLGTTGTSSEAMIEAVRRLNSLNEMADQCGMPRQKPVFHSNRNGMNGMFGYDLNVRVQPTGPGSPSSSSIQIGSPKQPDLALQL
ncbi:unnamed protein product [Cuscuta epithymum]|uniref:Bromo domain-containing protein n=1 Tax=Cuscuta epithymum TaxID=186058 RepID=A0AAV0G0Z1_9ASTE|nr:unnamed protein product [Cuscuta epithymum]